MHRARGQLLLARGLHQREWQQLRPGLCVHRRGECAHPVPGGLLPHPGGAGALWASPAVRQVRDVPRRQKQQPRGVYLQHVRGLLAGPLFGCWCSALRAMCGGHLQRHHRCDQLQCLRCRELLHTRRLRLLTVPAGYLERSCGAARVPNLPRGNLQHRAGRNLLHRVRQLRRGQLRDCRWRGCVHSLFSRVRICGNWRVVCSHVRRVHAGALCCRRGRERVHSVPCGLQVPWFQRHRAPRL
jgi:hypothetical protein